MKARKGILAAAAAAATLSLVLVGCAPEADDDDDGAQDPQSSSSSQPNDSGDASDTGEGADLATTEFALSWQDAVDQATQSFDGDLSSIELDWQQTQYAYTVELVSSEEEYEVKIDANSGDVLAEQTETMDSDDAAEKQAEIVDVQKVVPYDDALMTATDASEGRVDEWKLEGTAGGAHYQFDIAPGAGRDLEVTVDAYTGEIVKQGD